ncbi:ubiquinone biosynthesis protein COQ9 [Lipomyces oligophaga]|uniref:ubiquinone biosynthesis protein COQ9 n=1 Tax=Lipomyces oligophaga TaxID=45792 RepID=UPI0034CFDBDD
MNTIRKFVPLRVSPLSRLKSPAPVVCARSYFSYDHPTESPYSTSQSLILSSALKHVPTVGFTKDALVFGSRDQGMLDSTHAVFQNGVFDLIIYHLYTERTKLAALKEAVDSEEKTVEAKVRRYCIERLKGNISLNDHWTEALAVMAVPTNVPTALKELADLADEIWFLAGDLSTDFSWYNRRAMLAAVYSATELYMTQDNSKEFVNTWDFLDRRLANADTLEKTLEGSSTWMLFTGMASINLLRSQLARG